MVKADLVDVLAGQFDMPKAQVERMIDAMVETVTKALKKGDEVKLYGLGKFQVKKKKARPGRNPQTGEKITIAARNSVSFSASTMLKDAVK